MKEEKVTRTVYTAEDGKEFLSKEECENYEKFVKEALSKIKYFCVECYPDLTETGRFMHKFHIAVFSYNFHKEIVIEWAIRKFGHYLGVGVQGYGFLPQFDVIESDKIKYDKCDPIIRGGTEIKCGKLFLSPKPVAGFPENLNYMKEWVFK